MAQPHQNRVRIFLDGWLARIGSAYNWICLVFWAVLGVYGLSLLLTGEGREAVDWVMPFFCLALAALHGLLIRSARRTKALIADFRLYCAVFSHSAERRIPDAARTLGDSPEDAVRKLRAMCRRGYFNGYIDHQAQRMVFPADSPHLTAAHCPGCGAVTAIAQSGDTCRYCGAPLRL